MKDKLNLLLIVALVVLAFASGSLWTQLKKTEKTQLENQAQESVAVDDQDDQPEESPTEEVLGAQQLAAILKEPVAVKGDSEAPVTIVEFSEYLCPFCAEYAGYNSVDSQPIDEGKTYQKIIDNYVATGKARYIFRDFPVHGSKAKELAEAAYCAGEQGDYWQYHDQLFANQVKLYQQEDLAGSLADLAGELGLAVDQFQTCYNSNKYTQEVEDNYQLGKEIKVSGTPTFFINSQKLVGAYPYEAFEQIIEQELAKNKAGN